MILTDEQKHIIDLSKRLNHNEILAITRAKKQLINNSANLLYYENKRQ